MRNGFEINISESEFKAKPQGEQNWVLFQGVTSVHRCIGRINDEGCEYAKRKNRYGLLKILSAISGGAIVGLGIVYILYQMMGK